MFDSRIEAVPLLVITVEEQGAALEEFAERLFVVLGSDDLSRLARFLQHRPVVGPKLAAVAALGPLFAQVMLPVTT